VHDLALVSRGAGLTHDLLIANVLERVRLWYLLRLGDRPEILQPIIKGSW
jgi:hypothetical protein